MKLRSVDVAALGDSPWGTPDPFTATSAPRAVELAVVGAGITGLSAALSAARAGVNVAVLDANLGRGATARSGGIVLGETLVGPAIGFDDCDLQLGQWIAAERADCDFEWTGCWELTRRAALSTTPMGWRDGNELHILTEVRGGLLDPSETAERTAAGKRARRRAHRRSARGNGDRAARDGTFLVGGGFTVEARRVIVATDAVAHRTIADPWPERTITVALQTESVPGLARVIGLERPFYTSELPLLWGRPLRDGSLLFGRELIEWAAGTPPARSAALVRAAGQRLAGRVRALHPALGSIGIRRIWAGPTARTGAGVPGLVFDPDGDTVLWAGGYGGHGLAQAFVVGRMAAAWVSGRDISSMCRRIRMQWPTDPGYRSAANFRSSRLM